MACMAIKAIIYIGRGSVVASGTTIYLSREDLLAGSYQGVRYGLLRIAEDCLRNMLF